MIHPTAVVDPKAEIAPSATIGPWSMIGAGVEIDEGSWIGPHVVINGPTRIGRDNKLYQFSSIGDAPQDKKYQGESSRLEIGDGNVIREYCTLNRGTDLGGGVTRIGDNNWIMAYVHVAHDCQLGNNITMANCTALAGHVEVQDYVTFGAFSLVHQFCALGAHSFTGGGSIIVKDVPPYVIVAGNSAQPHGINVVGLKRRDFSAETLQTLRRAYKVVYMRGLKLEDALSQLETPAQESAEVQAFVDFIRSSKRGIVR